MPTHRNRYDDNGWFSYGRDGWSRYRHDHESWDYYDPPAPKYRFSPEDRVQVTSTEGTSFKETDVLRVKACHTSIGSGNKYYTVAHLCGRGNTYVMERDLKLFVKPTA